MIKNLTNINSITIAVVEFFLYLCGTKVAKGKNNRPTHLLNFQLFLFNYCVIKINSLSLHYKFKTDIQ